MIVTDMGHEPCYKSYLTALNICSILFSGMEKDVLCQETHKRGDMMCLS